MADVQRVSDQLRIRRFTHETKFTQGMTYWFGLAFEVEGDDPINADFRAQLFSGSEPCGFDPLTVPWNRCA